MAGIFEGLLPQVKRKIFVSYHHFGDQWYYDEFSRVFSDTYEVIQDRSLRNALDSENPDYVMRGIREKYITGTSCTIVLCGAQTHLRKYVDWEIKATLDKGHGLIGVNLPSSTFDQAGVLVPERFKDNLRIGYAVWLHWADLSPQTLAKSIEAVNAKSASLIDNSRTMRRRNG